MYMNRIIERSIGGRPVHDEDLTRERNRTSDSQHPRRDATDNSSRRRLTRAFCRSDTPRRVSRMQFRTSCKSESGLIASLIKNLD